MIDERTRQEIEYYLPNPPDPDLQDNEFYWLQYTNGATGNPWVIRVFPLDILPHKDGTEYGIYTKRGGRLQWVDAGYGTDTRGVRRYDLYDNKQDCRNQTHMCCDYWEHLREIQRKEGLI